MITIFQTPLQSFKVLIKTITKIFVEVAMNMTISEVDLEICLTRSSIFVTEFSSFNAYVYCHIYEFLKPEFFRNYIVL